MKYTRDNKGRFSERWLKIKNIFKRVGVLVFAIGFFCAILQSIQVVYPNQVFAESEVRKTKTELPPILQRICKAESGNRQFNIKGDVLRNSKTPSDIGFCQIHETIWNDQARKMGLDIYTEEGNKQMAVWIFENYGTEPWNASKANWK